MSLLHRTHAGHDDLPELTPAQLAELDALDAAIAGEEIADAGLAALVREVRSAAPELGTDGTQRVKERLATATGPGPGDEARAPWRRLRLPIYGPAAGAASFLVVLAVAGAGTAIIASSQRATDDAAVSSAIEPASVGPAADPDAPPAASDGAVVPRAEFTPESGAQQSASSVGASGAAAASDTESRQATPSSAARAPSQLLRVEPSRTEGRAVERTVDLAVRVKTGELQDAAGKVNGITRDANGYVASSELNLGAAGAGSATFSLRVDTSRLDRAIDRLSALGTVSSQNESSRDITSALDSAKQRLADARKEREALLRSLSKAKTAGEIASLRARISANRAELARLDTQVQRVQRRADLTTISLTLEAPAKGDPAADDGSWSLGDAAGDAWSALRAILGGMLVAAAVVAPFALLGTAGAAIWHRRRRAARERALDA